MILAEQLLLLFLDDEKGSRQRELGRRPRPRRRAPARPHPPGRAGGGATASSSRSTAPRPSTRCSTAAHRAIADDAKRRDAKGWVGQLPTRAQADEGADRGPARRAGRPRPRSATSCSACSRPPASRRRPGTGARAARAAARDPHLGERQPTPQEAMLIGLLRPYDLLERLVAEGPPQGRQAAREGGRRGRHRRRGRRRTRWRGSRPRSWPRWRSPPRPSRPPRATESATPAAVWHTASRSVVSAREPIMGEESPNMADAVRVSVTVNGQLQTAEVEPRLLLVHFLRDTLGLTGTHVGCDTSNCGACTVHLDGESGEELHDPRGPGRRAERAHDRGHGRRRPTCTRCRRASGPSTACSAATARPA